MGLESIRLFGSRTSIRPFNVSHCLASKLVPFYMLQERNIEHRRRSLSASLSDSTERCPNGYAGRQ